MIFSTTLCLSYPLLNDKLGLRVQLNGKGVVDIMKQVQAGVLLIDPILLTSIF